jgi:hypothetical protein
MDDCDSCGLPRRSFLRRMGFACTAGAGGLGGVWTLPVITLGEENRGPVNCGPPPLAAPQHRKGAEGFAPLPLPVTPLRRTEKKRPPAPPALVGKMAMGPIRWMTEGEKRTKYRDWMTDPADVNTLLTWTSEKLGINYRSVEADFDHFSFDPRELPAVLLAGHNKFTLSDEIRPRLARYVQDGGTIIGDACCGWEDFADSFRQEMESIFSGRPLRKMLPDDPLFSSYYKLGNLTYKKGDGSTFTEEPCLESIDLGCRSGVIFSPRDLTCGWDGHEHPRGTRVVIDQARQIGANLITYLLGMYQLARFLSSTKVYHEAAAPSRDDFVFAQLVHQGDWDPDPSAVHNLLKFARDRSTLEVKFRRENVRLADPQMTGYPLLYMTGHREFQWDADEIARLRSYLTAGGMLLADACCGRISFDASFRQQIAKVLPEAKLERLPADHPLLQCHFDVRRVGYTPRVREDFGDLEASELEGVTIDGRLAVVYSRFDLGNGWEQFPHAYSYGLKDDSALQVGTNAIVYAITH